MLQLLRKVLLSLCIVNVILRVSAGTFNVENDDDFKNKVLKSEVPVIVHFHATWCGPCKMLTPRLETIVAQNGKMDLAKVDIDSLDSIAMEYNVESVPYVFAMKNGEVVDKFLGLKDEDEIRVFVEKLAL